jgi:hypothetical protein
MFPVRYGHTYRAELSFKYKTGRWIMLRIVIVILKYHRHNRIDDRYINIPSSHTSRHQ